MLPIQHTAGPSIQSAGSDAVFLLETVDASAGIDELLLAREKRMAARANFDAEVGLDRTRLERIAASASDRCHLVLRMNALFHLVHLFHALGLKRTQS